MEVKKITDQEDTFLKEKQTADILVRLFGLGAAADFTSINDEVGQRRLKNSAKVLAPVDAFVKENGIEPKPVAFKVMAPLIKAISYEEDESIQKLWSNLIKNIISKPSFITLQKSAVEILSRISNEDAILLNEIFERTLKSRIEVAEKHNKKKSESRPPDSFPLFEFGVSIEQLAEDLNFDRNNTGILISNLKALGLIDFKIDASGFGHTQSGSVWVSVDIDDQKEVYLTDLGFAFVELCKSES